MSKSKQLIILIYILIIWDFLLGFGLQAQNMDATLKFQTDSLHIGKSCTLRLTMRIPGEMEVFVRDAADAFYNFEKLSQRDYPPQDLKDYTMLRRDYILRTFEVVSRHAVLLEVEGYLGADKTLFEVRSDTIILVEQVDSTLLVDGAYLRNESLISISDPPNYQKLFIGVLAGLLILLLLALLLRKPIKHFTKRQKIRKRWLYVNREWERIIQQSNTSLELVTKLDALWKVYLGESFQVEFRSLTTTEITEAFSEMPNLDLDEKMNLSMALMMKDRIVHGGEPVPEQQLCGLAEDVRLVMEKEYKRRINRVKHSS